MVHGTTRTALLGVLVLAGCPPPQHDQYVADEFLDPKTCETCHPNHYRQWLGSMHAYAAEDPVFLAMNARGQRETGGKLGDFCVQCHAPLAVQLGLTKDGLNLAMLPPHVRGVTCYFCHNVDAVAGEFNNPLVLAHDTVMRGRYSDPIENDFHTSKYSPYLDGDAVRSANMCGSCHDIVTDAGVHLERTFAEWKNSFYSQVDPNDPERPLPGVGSTCGQCHMSSERSPIADYPGVVERRIHDHRLVGVDVALTDFPDAELGPVLRQEQLDHMSRLRDAATCAGICALDNGMGARDIEVWLHNEQVGHGWPSGANQDRRAWVELLVHRGDQVVFQSGVVADGEPLDTLDDAHLWVFRDSIYDADGDQVHMFWEATDYDSLQLGAPPQPGAVNDRQTWRSKRYTIGDTFDRATMRFRLRPMDLSVVDDLIASGDLDANVRDNITTFDIPRSNLEWTEATATPTARHGTCVWVQPCFETITNDP